MTALTDRLQKELDERSKQFQEMGSQATLAFLRQHLNDPDGGYDQNPANDALLFDYIRAHKLMCTVENLNEAYTATADRQTHKAAATPQGESK